jgi:hypothetical protein
MVAAVAVAALLIGFAAGYFLFHEETAESASLACSAINKVKPIDSMRDIGPFNKDPTADMLEGAWSFAKAAALEDDKYERLGTIADEMRRAMSTFKEDDLVSSIKDFKSECERL